MLFEDLKKLIIYAALVNWLIIVAMAAPLTPMPNPKINTGSSIILQTAPISMEYMAALGLPSALIRLFELMAKEKEINPISIMDI